jgi:hypothetical protein
MFRIVLILVLWLVAFTLNASVIDKLLPQNIELGLSTEQLKAVRPAAARSPAALLPLSGQVSPSSFEMVERTSPATFYTYVFRDNILQAVIRSEPVVPDLAPTMIPAELNNLLSQDFQFLRSEKIARASGTLEHFPVTADLWSDPKTGLQSYFVSTSQETTLILFNPSKLNGGNFFVGADKIPELKAGADAIRSQTKTDPKATPPLVDRPWKAAPTGSPVDLLSVPDQALSQNITNETTRADVPSPTSPAFPSSIEQPQVSPPVNWLVVLAVILVAGTGVLVFILNRR